MEKISNIDNIISYISVARIVWNVIYFVTRLWGGTSNLIWKRPARPYV